MIVHVLVHFLSRITIVNETIAEFVEELEGCDFDAVELTISEKDIADFCFTDDVGEAFEFVSSRLLAGDAHIAEDVGHGE